MIGGFVLAILRGRTPMIRMLGVVALLSGIAYLFTPLTAAGPQGDPTAFDGQPALRLAGARRSGRCCSPSIPGCCKPRVQPWLLGALVILLLVQAVPVWDLHETSGRATSWSGRSCWRSS